MAITVSSYEIIFPESREIIMVNAQPGEQVDNRVVMNPTLTQKAMIQSYEDFQSVLFDDGGPAYTTFLTELRANDGSVTTLMSLDGSIVLDHEKCVTITGFIHHCESLRVKELEEKISVKIGGNYNEEEEEEDVCVICLRGCQIGDICAALECNHWHHELCILEWLQQNKHCPFHCPFCMAEVIPYLSSINRFRAGARMILNVGSAQC